MNIDKSFGKLLMKKLNLNETNFGKVKKQVKRKRKTKSVKPKPKIKSTTSKRTDPKLWEKIKKKYMKGDKGGKKGQWSARKAQLAVQEYKKRGGKYKSKKSKSNKLTKWTREDWGTRSGNPSIQGKKATGERYLPKKAREALTKREYTTTTQKKREAIKRGKQHSKQPKKIATKTKKYRK